MRNFSILVEIQFTEFITDKASDWVDMILIETVELELFIFLMV